MTQSKSVEIVGADRFARTMLAAASDIAHPTQAASEAGRVVQEQGSRNAPRRTGRLAGSIRARTSGGNAEIGSDLIYAPVIHNGWPAHNIRANPFLRRALDQRATQIVAIYTREMSNALKQVKGA